MFFCIHCKVLHIAQSVDRVFRTGFRELPTGDKVPLGACSREASRMKRKVELIRAEHGAAYHEDIALTS